MILVVITICLLCAFAGDVDSDTTPGLLNDSDNDRYRSEQHRLILILILITIDRPVGGDPPLKGTKDHPMLATPQLGMLPASGGTPQEKRAIWSRKQWKMATFDPPPATLLSPKY